MKTESNEQRHQRLRAKHADIAVSAVVATFMRLGKEIVYHPDMLRAEGQAVGHKVEMIAQPHPEDFRKLVGARGATFHAVLAVLQQVAGKHGFGLHYSIDDPHTHARSDEPPFKPRPDWPKAKLRGLLNVVCESMFAHAFQVRYLDEPGQTLAFVELDPDEKLHAAGLKDGLSKAMNAAGKANGRQFYVDGLSRRNGL